MGSSLLREDDDDGRGRSGQLVLDVDRRVESRASVALAVGYIAAKDEKGRRRGRSWGLPRWSSGAGSGGAATVLAEP
jgi:hypothetical protein